MSTNNNKLVYKPVYRPLTPYKYQRSLFSQQRKLPSLPDNIFKSKKELISDFIDQYKINNIFSEKLQLLEEYKIVLLLDDSGSMNIPLNYNTFHINRWDELKENVKIIIKLATIYDESGIDIHLLNRPSFYNVKSLEQIDDILEEDPSGSLPFTQKLEHIFNNLKESIKPVLVIIATTGLPNKKGYCDLLNFKNLLLQKNHSRFFISFLACSDQECDIGYLNELKIPNVETLHDYSSEKKILLLSKGKKFNYTNGDHIVRLLLRPICKDFDKYNENQLQKKCNIL
jgi:hypothetical protein